MLSGTIYDSPRLAARYADSRPPVHGQILQAARTRLERLGVVPALRALDIGCGAGLSTAALARLASTVVGIDPVNTMLRHHGKVAPDARFAVARAEHLPFARGSFDLVAAAGALNYADRSLALPEVARVLNGRGALLIYDFSSGRRIDGDPRLDGWFTAFERRYPFPPGYEMDVQGLDFEAAGLRGAGFETLEVAVPMTGDAYLAYATSETNVEQAIAGGAAEEEIAGWCRDTLGDIFGGGAREVLFDGYFAVATPAATSSRSTCG